MTLDFIKVGKGKVVVEINAKVFPIDLIYEASYAIMDRAHVVLDGSPNDKVKAILEPRKFKGDLAELGRIFYDELISAAFQTVQFVRNKEMREALMRSISQEVEEVIEDEEFDEKDIATLWEDKFGGKD